MPVTIHSLPTAKDALAQAGATFNELLRKSVGQPTLFLSSGGSSLGILNFVDAKNLGSFLTVSVSDDRFSDDPAINNFSQLMALPFYESAQKANCRFIDTRPKGASLNETGERFNQSLRRWVAAHPDGTVIMTEGIGPDRHTCGMMPYPEAPNQFKDLFMNNDIWALGYDNHGKNEFHERITVTIPFLRQFVKASIVYATGESKREALEATLAPIGTLAETPARIIQELPHVELYTDITLD